MFCFPLLLQSLIFHQFRSLNLRDPNLHFIDISSTKTGRKAKQMWGGFERNNQSKDIFLTLDTQSILLTSPCLTYYPYLDIKRFREFLCSHIHDQLVVYKQQPKVSQITRPHATGLSRETVSSFLTLEWGRCVPKEQTCQCTTIL